MKSGGVGMSQKNGGLKTWQTLSENRRELFAYHISGSVLSPIIRNLKHFQSGSDPHLKFPSENT